VSEFKKEVEAAICLPVNWYSYAILSLGYPMVRFGPVRRVVVADVVFEDRSAQLHSEA
jgi:hypothetical protein